MRLVTREGCQATPQHSVGCVACKYCVMLRAETHHALTIRLADGGENDNLLWKLMRLIIVPAWMDGPSYLHMSHKIATSKAVTPGKVRVSSTLQISPQQDKDDIFLSWKIVTHLSTVCHGHMVLSN